MTDTSITVVDHAPKNEHFLQEVLRGLRASNKQLPCKYLYDEKGSALYDRICELPEYYPARAEFEIMEDAAGEMADVLGENLMLVEYGSGSSLKTRLLLDVLKQPAAYVPVDISREHLRRSVAELAVEYPQIEMLPVCADFTKRFALPASTRRPTRNAVYFPGSTIGNLGKVQAAALLAGAAERCGPGGVLLIGVDLVKDRETLVRAYDDSAGVTAAFNLNLLIRMNCELGANFDVERFQHRAVWVEDCDRIEMHLVSEVKQSVRVGGESIHFEEGETICTEHAHKYTFESFEKLAENAGFSVERVWTDKKKLFSVQLLRAEG